MFGLWLVFTFRFKTCPAHSNNICCPLFFFLKLHSYWIRSFVIKLPSYFKNGHFEYFKSSQIINYLSWITRAAKKKGRKYRNGHHLDNLDRYALAKLEIADVWWKMFNVYKHSVINSSQSFYFTFSVSFFFAWSS